MLFNSYEFIFVFLPVTLLGFFLIARSSHNLAMLWLTAASIFFYGAWNPRLVLLLLSSIAFNYAMAYAIARARNTRRARPLLMAAVAANLVLLSFFKYTNFFITNVNDLAGSHWALLDIVLPLGISFFTLTQIAFLVDVFRGIAREYNFIHYALFVSYFPHLIAGPVLHHKQMMPQFSSSGIYRVNLENLAVGLGIFAVGLAKKLLLADTFGEYASPLFDEAKHGAQPAMSVAWAGALAYTLQLYFDFSGYSDMAIGISRMFGIRLPINFDSPYKAPSIIEFWRRWHMTLSQFLRDYLYFALGGNRMGNARRYVNVAITMLIGGLWHGANLTFVVWGGLHGLYLIINHAWRELHMRLGTPARRPSTVGKALGIGLTFLSVIVAWVFFRAENLATAVVILKGMAGCFELLERVSDRSLLALGVGLFIAFFLPNTQEIFGRYRIALPEESRDIKSGRYSVSLSKALGIAVGALLFCSILLLGKRSEFLYFQF